MLNLFNHCLGGKEGNKDPIVNHDAFLPTPAESSSKPSREVSQKDIETEDDTTEWVPLSAKEEYTVKESTAKESTVSSKNTIGLFAGMSTKGAPPASQTEYHVSQAKPPVHPTSNLLGVDLLDKENSSSTADDKTQVKKKKSKKSKKTKKSSLDTRTPILSPTKVEALRDKGGTIPDSIVAR